MNGSEPPMNVHPPFIISNFIKHDYPYIHACVPAHINTLPNRTCSSQSRGQHERNPAAHRQTGDQRRAVMKRAFALTVAGLIATTPLATGASAKGFHPYMLSVDTTQGGKPVIHDNGVPDGRVCKIFFRQV